MNKRPFLDGVGHQSRALFFMLGALVFYCLWLWFLTVFGVVNSESSNTFVATLLLLPLAPVAAFDLRLRLTWQPDIPTLYPLPPTRLQRLFEVQYGLYWFPWLICIPLWVWGSGLIGWILFDWIAS
jgi:hypothetical protein